MEGNVPDWVLFFGRFHPLILHVPIGFLSLAFLLEILSRFKRFHHFKAPVGFVLALGAASALLACVLGLMLAQSGGYDDDLLFVHQWSGVAVGVFSLGAFVLKWFGTRTMSAQLDKIYLASMWAMMLTITVAGHYGGSLTHGSDYLTRYMPEGLRIIAGVPAHQAYEKKIITNLDSAVVYADIIDPILHNHCTSCHNESKRKGDLMMHTPSAMLEGGEHGELFVSGDAAGSLMMKRIQLPEDHDDHMPPKGKSQLSRKDIDLLNWWINQGAPFDKKVSQVNVPGDVQSILDELVAPDANKSEVQVLLSSKTTPVSEQILLQVRRKGLSIEPLSAEISWLQADVAPDAAADSLLHSIKIVSENVTWLNLAGTSTTDDGLSSVADFKYLTRLHVGNTAITDKGLAYLKNLSYLESLNLYGTQVSDEGLQLLSELKNLRTLYLWKTAVTPEGVSRLQHALPELRINLGTEVSSNKNLSLQ